MMIKSIKEYVKKIESDLSIAINKYLLESQKQILVDNFKSVGQNCLFQMPICITGGESVEIGDDVSIAAYVHMWGEGGIKIGNRVMIASHTAITSLTHDYQQEDMRQTLIKGRVTIEDDVWIGSHSIILPGISIAKGAVVGAGSVVTKNVQPYSIVFGTPAIHYKFREISQKSREIND